MAVAQTLIPEVCGEALLTENGTGSELAQAMKTLTENGELRTKLLHAGLERAERFSWDAGAERTHEVYERILDEQFEMQADRAERERSREEFHLLSFAEIAYIRAGLEGVIEGSERATQT